MKKARGGPVAVCIIVENLPVPLDRRVWQEARTLAQAGYQVSVICPKGPGFERSREQLDGVQIRRHRACEASGTLFGYLLEYSWALVAEFFLALRIYARTRFRILQACNPPDTIFLIALFFKLFGVRFIFDHHDLNPELYALRFPGRSFVYKLVCLAERLTFRTADVVLATNTSCRDIAMDRGRVLPDRIFVVRTCPDLNEFRPVPAKPELKRGRKYLVVYLGMMGPQDGLDLLVDSIDLFVKKRGCNDTLFILIGLGPELPRLKARVATSGLEEHVMFTGPLYGDQLSAYLATADVGVAPDPSNAFNDKLTMIKIFEYMAYGLPVVLYDLVEGRQSADGAALYATANDPAEFAEQITRLLDSESLQRKLGAIGEKRVRDTLNWSIEKSNLLRAYQTALLGHRACPPCPELMQAGTSKFAD